MRGGTAGAHRSAGEPNEASPTGPTPGRYQIESTADTCIPGGIHHRPACLWRRAVAAGSASATPEASGASPVSRAVTALSGEPVKTERSMTLRVSAASGDTTCQDTATTTFQRTLDHRASRYHRGKCIVATGQKDAAAKATATAVRPSDPVGGACSLGGPGAGGGGCGRGGTPADQRPRPTARPARWRPTSPSSAGKGLPAGGNSCHDPAYQSQPARRSRWPTSVTGHDVGAAASH